MNLRVAIFKYQKVKRDAEVEGRYMTTLSLIHEMKAEGKVEGIEQGGDIAH